MTKITTQNGYTVELKEFITGKEKRYISDAFLEDAEINSDGTFKMTPGKMHSAEDRAIEVIVLSVDGDGVNKETTVLEQVLEMRSEDFVEVVKAINEITENKKKETSTEKI